jgi:hypothetical protein
MSPAKIIEAAFLDGLNLAITPEGQLHYSGDVNVVERWLPVLREKKTEILVALASFNKLASEADNGKAAISSRWWRFHYADRHPKEACYCPPASKVYALAGEPDAITAEAFESVLREPGEPLNEKDEALVRAWLADIGEDDEGVTLALEKCRTDQDAREGFLQMAKQWYENLPWKKRVAYIYNPVEQLL